MAPSRSAAVTRHGDNFGVQARRSTMAAATGSPTTPAGRSGPRPAKEAVGSPPKRDIAAAVDRETRRAAGRDRAASPARRDLRTGSDLRDGSLPPSAGLQPN